MECGGRAQRRHRFGFFAKAWWPDPLHGATLVVDLAGMPAASALLRRRRA
jgi:hypothetical protein